MVDSKDILSGNSYTRKQVANMLHVSTITIDNYIKKKQLKALKIGGKVLITETALKEFLDQAKEK